MDTGGVVAGDIWARDWFSQEAGGYIRDIWGSPWGWGTQRDMDGGWRVGERGGSAWGRTWGHPLGDTLREHGGIMEGMVVLVMVMVMMVVVVVVM